MTEKTLIMIPAYNEIDNLKELLPGIVHHLPGCHILVIDSGSPDNTAGFIAQTSAQDPRIHLITRPFPDGRGLADLDGFHYALSRDFEIIIQMDADLSHDPRFLPGMLAALETSDVVIGSRLIPGGEMKNRTRTRALLTRLANIYIRTLLKLNTQDCTSGFREYRRAVLESLNLNAIRSRGPADLVEILCQCRKKGFRIREIPISFHDRKKGASKLKLTDLTESIFSVLRTALSSRV